VLKAPAKVNLHLEILGRRGDGFHEILSLFQAVSLFDRIALRSLKVTGQVRVACTAPIPAERNIVTAALRAFRAKTGIEEGIDLRVWKSIPIGAGLGGGSSDAAATLRGLNGMFGRPLDGGLLAELAAGLGSDVPFFLEGGTALVGGRGERVTRVAGRGDYRIVLSGRVSGWIPARPTAGMTRPGIAERPWVPRRCGNVSSGSRRRSGVTSTPSRRSWRGATRC